MTKIYKFIYKYSSFNPFVILASLVFLIGLVICSLVAPNSTLQVLNYIKSIIFDYFSWFYILVASAFLFFLIFIALSRFGDIKLGDNEEEPEFSYMSWLSMLFVAGMGVGLMFFGVAEPLSHSLQPSLAPTGASSAVIQREAMVHTIFHWGIHAWTIYGVIALSLAYFGFRYKLPLSIRSCFYPLLKNRINGRIGDIVDIMALTATLFGIITTLGYGAMQMSAGFEQMGWIENSGLGTQIIVIIVVMFLAIFSAISGVEKGIRMLSELNLLLALSLLLFVLFSGETIYVLGAFSNNIGHYLSSLIGLSFKTYVYQSENLNWFTNWTILYWAWWFSWAPFVGLFIARISRGRTIREFIFGVLVLPSLLCVLWFSVFGNNAFWINEHLAGGALDKLVSAPEKLLFAFLEYLPLPAITGFVALVVIGLFFITSANSGIYVLNNIASIDKSKKNPHWQTIMWGTLMAVIAIVLLKSGGLGTLQAMTLIVALPFAILMGIMCISLLKALGIDSKYFDTRLNPTSVFWSGAHWKKRLNQILNQSKESDIEEFIEKTVYPAFISLKDELTENYGFTIIIDQKPLDISLRIKKQTIRDFVYGVHSVSREVSKQLIKDKQLPHIQNKIIYEPITYFSDGRTGYDIQYMSEQELIADVLKQYERYLSLVDEVGEELLSHKISKLTE